MLRKLALASAVSGMTIATALAQSPAPPAGAPGEPPAATQSTPKADMPASRVETRPSAMGAGSASFVASQKPDQWLASKFKGTDVLGPDNEKVGDVTDILFDKNGKIDAYVVSVGGFLGIGAKEVALPPSAFQVVAPDSSNAPANSSGSSSKLKISMTKDQLKQAANFEPYKEPARTTTGAGGAPRPMAPAPNR